MITKAINVMKGAEAISEHTSLPRQEVFDIEYWLLEEAKLPRMPRPKALSGQIALITGSAGGIGEAIAKKFADEGAVVILNDMNKERLENHIMFKDIPQSNSLEKIKKFASTMTIMQPRGTQQLLQLMQSVEPTTKNQFSLLVEQTKVFLLILWSRVSLLE